MHIISKKALDDFSKEHVDAKHPLDVWHQTTERVVWKDFAAVRATFNSADLAGKCVVFNIGGNKFRLIVTIAYTYKRVYIRHVFTHKEYDKNAWKKGCECQ